MGRNWLDEHDTGSGAWLRPVMTDDRHPMDIEYLRCELLDLVDAQPFEEWSPTLLRALIAVFELNGVTPGAPRNFRPYLVR